jgi:hypothetical protein
MGTLLIILLGLLMAKLTLNAIGSRYGSIDALNDNSDLIETAFENTLSRDGTGPNNMESDLDMDSNDIINVANLSVASLRVNGQPVSPGSINYTGQVKETQTATSGQTVFNLSTVSYAPLTNNLSVYVDGVYQNPTTYTENNSTRITFDAGVHTGAVVDFVVLSLTDLPGTTDASNVTYSPAGSGAVTTTVAAKLQQTVSVMDFGAVGDGVTDDTTAIQAAIAYAASANGATILFPAGTYSYTDFVVDVSNTHIVGVGWGVTILKPQGWIDGIRFANGYPGANPIVYNVSISNLTMDCTAQIAGPNDTYGNGINFNNCDSFAARDVQVLKHKQQGIVSSYFNGSSLYPVQSVGYIVDNEVDSTQSNNICIGVEAQPQGLIISRNRVKVPGNASTVALYVGNATGIQAGGDIIVTDNIVTGPVGSTGIGVKVENTQNRVVISNNNIYGLGTGIRVQRNTVGAFTHNYTITGNSVQNFTTYGIIAFPIPTAENSKVLISANHIYTDNAGSGDSRAVYVASNAFVSGNFISAATEFGVFVVGTNSVVSGNYIERASEYAVDSTLSTTAYIVNNYVSRNIQRAADTIAYGNIGSSAPNWNRQFIGAGEVRRNPNGNSAPISGTWKVGDQVYNTGPTAGGYLGWVCITAGTPGTWKEFGAIEL